MPPSLPLLDSLFLFLMLLSCICERYPSVEQSYRYIFLVADEEMYKYAVGGFLFHLFPSFLLFFLTPKMGFFLGGGDVYSFFSFPFSWYSS